MIFALVLAAVLADGSTRVSILRSAGWALVLSTPVEPADIIVLSPDSGGAGPLEAADLIRSGIATRVAVFTDPPSGDDHEFIRRGLPYEDAGARQVRQLGWLGVTDVVRIPRTAGFVQVLKSWCEKNQFRSIVFVEEMSRSRRMRRVLARFMKGNATRVTVQPTRYSNYDPDRWWETRGGVRTAIVELQRLALDFVLHPISF